MDEKFAYYSVENDSEDNDEDDFKDLLDEMHFKWNRNWARQVQLFSRAKFAIAKINAIFNAYLKYPKFSNLIPLYLTHF